MTTDKLLKEARDMVDAAHQLMLAACGKYNQITAEAELEAQNSEYGHESERAYEYCDRIKGRMDAEANNLLAIVRLLGD